MRFWLCVLVVVVAFGVRRSADASIIASYDVSSAQSGGPAPHGLWAPLHRYRGNHERFYFDIQPGTTFTQYDNDTPGDLSDDYAELLGSAINPDSDVATFSLTFRDLHANPVKDLYGSVVGQIDVFGGTMLIDLSLGPQVLQLGLGVLGVFDGSPNQDIGRGWLLGAWEDGSPMRGLWALDFQLEPNVVPVVQAFAEPFELTVHSNPEPSTIVMWMVLIPVLGAVVYRQRKSAA